MVHKKVHKYFKVKGFMMSSKEYSAFVKYLNENHVQSFTKQDVSNFLEFFYSGDYGRKL